MSARQKVAYAAVIGLLQAATSLMQGVGYIAAATSLGQMKLRAVRRLHGVASA